MSWPTSAAGRWSSSNGEVIGQVDLPIAGLMSNEHAEVVARKAATVLDGFRACGCKLNNPNMQLSLLALVVIPELRISDLGLVDVNRFQIHPGHRNRVKSCRTNNARIKTFTRPDDCRASLAG